MHTSSSVLRATVVLAGVLASSLWPGCDGAPRRDLDAGRSADAASSAGDAATHDAASHDAPPFEPDARPVDAGPSAPDTLARGVVVEPPFDAHYRAYDLGPIPGLSGTRYGGCVVSRDDPDALLVGVDSEAPSGALYAVGLVRGAEGHIVAFSGVARKVADVPYIDANLMYDAAGNLVVTAYPVNELAVLGPGESAPRQRLDLGALGVASSIGGAAFVPTRFGASAGELRVLSWPSQGWYRVLYRYEGGEYRLISAEQRATLPAGSGGVAYVPPGSPGLDRDSLIVAEWPNSVGVLELDASGDVLPETRRPFLSGLEVSWGAYFEPVTGDFIFPEWGGEGRVIIVQGFRPPPAPPELI